MINTCFENGLRRRAEVPSLSTQYIKLANMCAYKIGTAELVRLSSLYNMVVFAGKDETISSAVKEYA